MTEIEASSCFWGKEPLRLLPGIHRFSFPYFLAQEPMGREPDNEIKNYQANIVLYVADKRDLKDDILATVIIDPEEMPVTNRIELFATRLASAYFPYIFPNADKGNVEIEFIRMLVIAMAVAMLSGVILYLVRYFVE